jgi:dienelactone hydrolase
VKIFFPLLVVFLFTGCGNGIRMDVPRANDSSAEPITNGIFYSPDGDGPFPTVVLMHGCEGLSPKVLEGLKSHANFFTDNGYAAFILDSFTKRGKKDGICFNSQESAYARTSYRQSDAYGAIKFLATLPNVDSTNFFVMGQSHGGGTVLYMADARATVSSSIDFNAVVAYYPGCSVPAKLKYPVLVLGGEADTWTNMSACLYSNGKDLGRPYKAIAYENAHHSFDLFIRVQKIGRGNVKVGGNSKARKASRQEMLAWFERFRK